MSNHYFALIDENNIVERVIHLDDNDVTNPETNEIDLDYGLNECVRKYGGEWVVSAGDSVISYMNRNLDETLRYDNTYPELPEELRVVRERTAVKGYTYDRENNRFLPPQSPHASWTYDRNSHEWVPPIPYPNNFRNYLTDNTVQTNGVVFEWNEELYQSDNTQGWVYKTEAQRKLDKLGLTVDDLKQLLDMP